MSIFSQGFPRTLSGFFFVVNYRTTLTQLVLRLLYKMTSGYGLRGAASRTSTTGKQPMTLAQAAAAKAAPVPLSTSAATQQKPPPKKAAPRKKATSSVIIEHDNEESDAMSGSATVPAKRKANGTASKPTSKATKVPGKATANQPAPSGIDIDTDTDAESNMGLTGKEEREFQLLLKKRQEAEKRKRLAENQGILRHIYSSRY